MTIEKWMSVNARSMAGKTVVITGAGGSLGREVLFLLVRLGARVIMAVRNPAKVTALKADILTSFPQAEIYISELDVSSDSSVEAFSQRLSQEFSCIDILINNAGIYHLPFSLSPDGYEIHYATNCRGPLRLSERLVPMMSHGGKIIFTTSIAADYVRLVPDDPQSLRLKNKTKLYGRTKLALEYGVAALSATVPVQAAAISVVLWHPGISATQLFLKKSGLLGGVAGGFIFHLMRLIFMKPQKACLSCIYAVCNDIPDGYTAGPRGLFHAWGYPTLYIKPSTKRITDPALRGNSL